LVIAVGLENVGTARSIRSLSGAVTRVVSCVDAAMLSADPADSEDAADAGGAGSVDAPHELVTSEVAMRETLVRPAPMNVRVTRRRRLAGDVVPLIMIVLLVLTARCGSRPILRQGNRMEADNA